MRPPWGERQAPPVRTSTWFGLRLPEVTVVPTSSGKSRPGAPVQGRRMRHGQRAGDRKGDPVTQVESAYVYRVGIDWASQHHQVCIVDRAGGCSEETVPHTSAGLAGLADKLAALSPEPVYIRTHNLLTSGDGTPALKWGSTGVYSEDAEGKPRYDWTILDRIFDTYLERGVRPYVQVGFMPKDLSVKPEPYQHTWTPTARYEQIYTGWAYPPKDYAKWGELVYQWTRHLIDRYGRAEVETWWWEVWNEPDIGYWRGTPEEFMKLYDFAADGLKRALPNARIGGPEVTGPNGMRTQQILLHAKLFLLVPVVERDTDRVGHRQHLVRAESHGAIRGNAAELLVDLHERNPGAQRQRDQSAHGFRIGHRRATGLAEVDEYFERLSAVVLGDVNEHRA